MNSNDAEIAAGEWLARLDQDDPDPQQLAAFERWKNADPRHAAAYARLTATWQALDRVQAIRPNRGEPVDDDYLNAAKRRAASMRRSSAPRRLWRGPRFLVPLAASLLIALAGLWISRDLRATHTYSTGIGGFQRVVLDDQSTIELNTDSEVRIAFTAGLRKVQLVRGEASFEVSHDSARPFIVSAGQTAVRAVGTEFDVNRLEGAVEVIVAQGKVAVGSPSVLEAKLDALPSAIPRLSAGQSAIAGGGGIELRDLGKGDLARKLAWRNQMLVFDGDSLAEVIAQFNRYNKRQLHISDPSLATRRIGGYFRPTNLDAFISVLQSDFGIRVDADDNRLELSASTAK
jgi:transmembrane sensor